MSDDVKSAPVDTKTLSNDEVATNSEKALESRKDEINSSSQNAKRQKKDREHKVT